MKNNKMIQRSPLALAILALVTEEPMHPYRMQQLIKERGKDEVINVRQRASIYQTIDRLQREGLLAIQETISKPGRPDRTIYQSTPKGQVLIKEWMREMLSKPTQEFPQFPVAIAFLPLLTKEDVQQQLQTRSIAYEMEWNRLNTQLQLETEGLPRIFLLETELKQAVLLTEWKWVQSIIEDLETGRLTWDEKWLREIGKLLTFSQEI